MLPHQPKTSLAGLLIVGSVAFGTTMVLWGMHADETQERGPKGACKKVAVDGERATDKNENTSANQVTRHAFAGAMSRIKEGMAAKDVLALLGKPDDVRTQHDPGGISAARTKEVWRYGTNGHLTFPTLGCVYLDNQGKVQYVFGGQGQPPDRKLFSESELRSLLRLIDKAPSYGSGYGYDPLAVIQIVNTLQPLGKEKALAAIEEYLRVASHFQSPAREGVFLVLRVLFDVPADPGYMPHMYVGGPLLGTRKDPKELSRFPIHLYDDVPFLVVFGYWIAGFPEQPESHVKYFRDKGRLRVRPLAPGNDPLGLLHQKEIASHDKLLVANQLLNLVDSVYRRDLNAYGCKFWATENVNEQWKSIERAVAKLEIRWNAEKSRYTFKEGSHLPDPIRKLYRRHIWKLEELKGEGMLIVERIDKKHVWLILEWSGSAGNEIQPFFVNVLAGKNKSKLAKLGPATTDGNSNGQGFFPTLSMWNWRKGRKSKHN